MGRLTQLKKLKKIYIKGLGFRIKINLVVTMGILFLSGSALVEKDTGM